MTPGGAPDTTPIKLVPNPAPAGLSSAADDAADALQVQVVRLTPLTTAQYQRGQSYSQTITINSATVQLRAASGADPPLPTPIKDSHDDDLCYGENSRMHKRIIDSQGQ